VSQPNDALGALVEEAGLSFAGLARRVVDLGKVCGLDLAYDYTAVHRWIKRGERPRTPGVPALIAEALSEKLGRRITPSDFGMTDEPTLAARALTYSPDLTATVETVVELGSADVKRRKVIAAAPFVLAALSTPSRDWLLASLDGAVSDRGPRRIGMQQIDGIRQMFRLFQEMDVMRGGGHARIALVEYMNSYVMPLLRRDHATDVQLALYEAAAEQAYLVGWMAYDDGQHGLAQRWLIQSLRLAEASGNRALGAHVLAGMSDQANLLGYPREALMLARAGQRAITIDDSPACLADLQVLEARALAALGGHDTDATRAVVRAEQTFQHVVHDNEPEWARFIDAAYLFGEAAHAFRDLGDPTQIHRFATESSAEAGRQKRARRGALSEAALAIGDLRQGEVDAAAARGLRVIDLASAVSSSRCIETIRDLTKQLKPYADRPSVQEFRHQACTLLQAA